MNSSPVGLLISRDLFFTSKVTGTAQMLGFSLAVVANVEAAAERIAEGGVRGVFCDLADPGLDVAKLMSSLAPADRPRVVAFGSHVATAALQAAREAGCEEVLPRSRFSADLPELLSKYLAAS